MSTSSSFGVESPELERPQGLAVRVPSLGLPQNSWAFVRTRPLCASQFTSTSLPQVASGGPAAVQRVPPASPGRQVGLPSGAQPVELAADAMGVRRLRELWHFWKPARRWRTLVLHRVSWQMKRR